MIQILHKSDCTGCWACAQGCPKHSITMLEDEEGFLYPQIDKVTCINCGLCEKVCPVINQEKAREPLVTYAAKNPQEKIRMISSSGGIFTMLAEEIIANNGVVFGAKFNEKWEVVHGYSETTEGIAAFRGSKYVQSIIGENYKLVENFLKDERDVLFSGTPCQIAGLKKYLKKDYKRLLTVDVVCHGVPSPLVWQEYLKSIHLKNNTERTAAFTFSKISFRDKSTGWEKYSFLIRGSKDYKQVEKTASMRANNDFIIIQETLNKNIFLKGFLKNIYLRPSCYKCPTKELKSNSDITIADFWGIQNVKPEIDDNKGVCLVLVNSEKGKSFYSKINTNSEQVEFKQGLSYNSAIVSSCKMPKTRDLFWDYFINKGLGIEFSILKSTRLTALQTVRKYITLLLPKSLKNNIRKIINL